MAYLMLFLLGYFMVAFSATWFFGMAALVASLGFLGLILAAFSLALLKGL
ncbi:hypothetical protein [Rhizobium sp. BK176]|nr:hypothetical protein [Rhizobium sp. BK176]MCS4089509.1 small-conductance mechanosensitive channel [Rhizobium sp. BK176]